MRVLKKMLRSMLFVIVNVLATAFVNGGLQFLLIFWQKQRGNTVLYVIVGLVLFLLLWKWLMAICALLFCNIAKISPYKKLSVITTFIVQGGAALAGIVFLWHGVFSMGGIKLFALVYPILLTLVIFNVAKHSIFGTLSWDDYDFDYFDDVAESGTNGSVSKNMNRVVVILVAGMLIAGFFLWFGLHTRSKGQERVDAAQHSILEAQEKLEIFKGDVEIAQKKLEEYEESLKPGSVVTGTASWNFYFVPAQNTESGKYFMPSKFPGYVLSSLTEDTHANSPVGAVKIISATAAITDVIWTEKDSYNQDISYTCEGVAIDVEYSLTAKKNVVSGESKITFAFPSLESFCFWYDAKLRVPLSLLESLSGLSLPNRTKGKIVNPSSYFVADVPYILSLKDFEQGLAEKQNVLREKSTDLATAQDEEREVKKEAAVEISAGEHKVVLGKMLATIGGLLLLVFAGSLAVYLMSHKKKREQGQERQENDTASYVVLDQDTGTGAQEVSAAFELDDDTDGAEVLETEPQKTRVELESKDSDQELQKQVMHLAMMPVHALESLRQNPNTVLLAADGTDLTFTPEAVDRALQAARLMEQGDGCSSKRQYAQAIEFYRQALELNPIDPILVMSLGVTLCMNGSVSEGLAALKKAVEICPSNYRERARVENNYRSALQHYGAM